MFHRWKYYIAGFFIVKTVFSGKGGAGNTCGATLIHQNWIITAAHCIPKFSVEYKDETGATQRSKQLTIETIIKRYGDVLGDIQQRNWLFLLQSNKIIIMQNSHQKSIFSIKTVIFRDLSRNLFRQTIILGFNIRNWFLALFVLNVQLSCMYIFWACLTWCNNGRFNSFKFYSEIEIWSCFSIKLDVHAGF